MMAAVGAVFITALVAIILAVVKGLSDSNPGLIVVAISLSAFVGLSGVLMKWVKYVFAVAFFLSSFRSFCIFIYLFICSLLLSFYTFVPFCFFFFTTPSCLSALRHCKCPLPHSSHNIYQPEHSTEMELLMTARSASRPSLLSTCSSPALVF